MDIAENRADQHAALAMAPFGRVPQEQELDFTCRHEAITLAGSTIDFWLRTAGLIGAERSDERVTGDAGAAILAWIIFCRIGDQAAMIMRF